MATSTNLISGLSSGIDWQTMVTQLIAVDHQRVDLVSSKKTASETKLSEWQSFNTKLLAMKTAAGDLKDAEDFSVFKAAMTSDSSTFEAADLLAVTPGATASVGSYSLKVNNLAAAQKLSSASFASASGTLGADYAGDLIINGTAITVDTADTLTSLKDKINSANSGDSPTGVTAGLISYGTGDNRLILSSDATGDAGISLKNGGGADILNLFGFSDTSRTVKNHLAGGDRTDRFTSTTVSIQSLLGLTDVQTSGGGDIVINGLAVGAIDLATDSLSALQTKFAAAGLTASITTETEDNTTYYRLLVEGAANTYTDKNNILETLGMIKGGVADVSGVTADVANTSAGAVITADTLIKDIDGYTGWAADDYILLEGTKTNSGGAVSDGSFTLAATKTVGELLTQIESLFGDVTASITGTGKIMVVDNTSGTSTLAVKIGAKNFGGANDNTLKFDADGNLGSAASVRKRQLVAGADASLTVDGVTVTRHENTIDDILSGVTLDLIKADAGTTIKLNIGRDTDTIITKINNFVASYNTISSYIHTQSSYDETEKKTGGVLFADGTLASVRTDMTSILIGSVWGVAADYATMGLVGISVDREGQLSVDESTLSGYLTANFNDVQKLFTANGATNAGSLAYVSQSNKTKAGEYDVHIVTAATKSTSAVSDNTSLSGAETLTITSGSSSAAIDLTSGMTMTQIVNAVNSELATVYTQTLAGNKSLYADAGEAAKITASTKWNSVYTGIDASANLTDGDVISFSGTAHNGVGVNGSYTISSAADDSVQGLLSAIGTAFGSQVTAAINASGQITLTDKTTGSSSVALTVDCTQAHDFDFGTVLTTNTGGQQGRYAMDMAASADSGNHLVIAHNSYGAGNSFTIHQENNLLWTSGDPTVTDGVDVAGTINGEAATGTGQTLKGNNDDDNVDGLVLKYTGTTSGVDAGTVKLTLGIGELYDRALFYITDSFDGYISNKQQSLQNNITGYQTQIDEMEARLDRKREQMLNRFAQMELALQKIQSQSNWLAGQTSAADKGWLSL